MEKCFYVDEEQRWWKAQAAREGGDIILLEEATDKIEAWRKFFTKRFVPCLLFNGEEKYEFISANDRKVIHQS